MLSKRIFAILSVWAGFAIAQTGAPNAQQRLESFLGDTRAFEAAFEQVVYDDQFQALDSSRGRVLIKRPGRFVWDYEPPADRKIVSNGINVWIYDIDIEQVTVQKLADTLGTSPAAVLAGSVKLDQDFGVADGGTQDDLAWVIVTPKSLDNNFERLRLGFQATELHRIEMVDALGQTTRIDFSDHRLNPSIDDSAFDFVAPEGIDIIDQTTRR